jgi:hypothetical protein
MLPLNPKKPLGIRLLSIRNLQGDHLGGKRKSVLEGILAQNKLADDSRHAVGCYQSADVGELSDKVSILRSSSKGMHRCLFHYT